MVEQIEIDTEFEDWSDIYNILGKVVSNNIEGMIRLEEQEKHEKYHELINTFLEVQPRLRLLCHDIEHRCNMNQLDSYMLPMREAILQAEDEVIRWKRRKDYVEGEEVDG